MENLNLLKNVQFVVGQDGRPSAVQMDIASWEASLDWLEDVEDRELIRAMLPKLRAGLKASGALRWEDVAAEWDAPETGEDE